MHIIRYIIVTVSMLVYISEAIEKKILTQDKTKQENSERTPILYYDNIYVCNCVYEPCTDTRATFRLTIDPRSYRRSPNDHSFSPTY